MRFVSAALLAVLLPTVALAQTVPYKLVIIWGGGDLVVTDYPSLARCERGKQAVTKDSEGDVALPAFNSSVVGSIDVGRQSKGLLRQADALALRPYPTA